jgi:hypothetical protein
MAVWRPPIRWSCVALVSSNPYSSPNAGNWNARRSLVAVTRFDLVAFQVSRCFIRRDWNFGSTRTSLFSYLKIVRPASSGNSRRRRALLNSHHGSNDGALQCVSICYGSRNNHGVGWRLVSGITIGAQWGTLSSILSLPRNSGLSIRVATFAWNFAFLLLGTLSWKASKMATYYPTFD